eukprot:5084638-Pyramimonas_sp.AAC.1
MACFTRGRERSAICEGSWPRGRERGVIYEGSWRRESECRVILVAPRGANVGLFVGDRGLGDAETVYVARGRGFGGENVDLERFLFHRPSSLSGRGLPLPLPPPLDLDGAGREVSESTRDYCLGSANLMYFYVSHGPPGIQATRFGGGNGVVFGSPPSRGLEQLTVGNRKQECTIGEWQLKLAQGAAA